MTRYIGHSLSIWNENHFSDFFNSIVDYLEEDWAWYKILNGNLDHVAHGGKKIFSLLWI